MILSLIIGEANRGRLLIMSYTERGNSIRLIRDFQEINYLNKRTTETQRTQRNKEERVF